MNIPVEQLGELIHVVDEELLVQYVDTAACRNTARYNSIDFPLQNKESVSM